MAVERHLITVHIFIGNTNYIIKATVLTCVLRAYCNFVIAVMQAFDKFICKRVKVLFFNAAAENNEFVTADPVRGMSAEHAAYSPRHFTKRIVALGVTFLIVYFLKTIEVHIHNADILFTGLGHSLAVINKFVSVIYICKSIYIA